MNAMVYLFAPRREGRKWKRRITIELVEPHGDNSYKSLEVLADTEIACDEDSDPGCFIINGNVRRIM